MKGHLCMGIIDTLGAQGNRVRKSKEASAESDVL